MWMTVRFLLNYVTGIIGHFWLTSGYLADQQIEDNVLRMFWPSSFGLYGKMQNAVKKVLTPICYWGNLVLYLLGISFKYGTSEKEVWRHQNNFFF